MKANGKIMRENLCNTSRTVVFIAQGKIGGKAPARHTLELRTGNVTF